MLNSNPFSKRSATSLTTRALTLVTGAALVTGAVLVAGAGILPGTAANAAENTAANAAVAGPSQTAQQVEACEVTDAQLSWGTLERWRSYISGSIAHGEWQLDGVDYVMPEFVWSNGSGFVAKNGQNAEISFAGSVLFTGHEDLLQVLAANPTLTVADGTAMLMLDLSSTTPTGEQDVLVEQEYAVEFNLDGAVQLDEQTFQIAAAPGVLTDEGAAAFGGFYDGGEEVDVVTLTATASGDCLFTLNGNGAADNGDLGIAGSAGGLPIYVWIIIAVAAVAVGATAGMLIVRKGRKS